MAGALLQATVHTLPSVYALFIFIEINALLMQMLGRIFIRGQSGFALC